MDENHPCFPETVYGAAKLAGEAYVRAYFHTHGLPAVIIRPFNNFGPRSHHESDAGEVIPRFVAWALNGCPPRIFGDGSQTRDFLYVADTASALCRAAECDDVVGHTINLGSGQETSIAELARLIYEEAGHPHFTPLHLPARPGDVRRHRASFAKAEKMLGFAPRTSLRHGVRRLIEHFRSLPQGVSALLNDVQEVNW
jgi:UDP-glucose 4-epimerase